MSADRVWATEFAVRSLASFARAPVSSFDAVRGRIGPPRGRERGGTIEPSDGVIQLMVRGWACRRRMLRDGVSQVFGLVLPGDLVGLPLDRHPSETCEIAALSGLVSVGLPMAGPSDDLLLRAMTFAQRAAEDQLFGQILRLGQLSAAEAVEHLLIEIATRLARVGLCQNGRFEFPLSQKVLAEILGMSSVHLNRTLADLRAAGRIQVGPGWMQISETPNI